MERNKLKGETKRSSGMGSLTLRKKAGTLLYVFFMPSQPGRLEFIRAIFDRKLIIKVPTQHEVSISGSISSPRC